MISTGDQYRESLRDGREVWIDGEKVRDITVHPEFARSSTSARACTTWSTRSATREHRAPTSTPPTSATR